MRAIGGFASLAAMLLASACAPRAQQPPPAAPVSDEVLSCEPRRASSTEEAVTWARAVIRRPGVQLREMGTLEVEYAGIPSSNGCVTAAVLAWGQDLLGGIVIAPPGG